MSIHSFTIDWSLHTLFQLLSSYSFNTVLDIGGGVGQHASFLRHFGKKVFTVGLLHNADYVGDFMKIKFDQKFDCIWCSHTLEHQRNIGAFLEKIFDLIEDNGVLALTVPYQEREVLLGGHVSIWDPGLLCYNLVLSGFDLSEAKILISYDLALTTIKKEAAGFKDIKNSSAIFDELETLQQYFPFKVHQRSCGIIRKVNWGGNSYNLPTPVLDGDIIINGRNTPHPGIRLCWERQPSV